MASSTEPTVVGDVVKSELPYSGSRDTRLVDASQTLAIGTVCTSGVGGRMKAVAAGVNEVQNVAITGTLTAGTFTLGVPMVDGGVEWTDPIAYDAADIAAIQTAIDTTNDGSHIVVSGTVRTDMTFTYSGATRAGVGWDLIQINTSGLTGLQATEITRTTAGGRQVAMTDEVQTATVTGTGSAGTFTLTVPLPNGTTMTTAAIAYNANAATIETALDTAFALQTPAVPAGVITVAGTNMDTGDITFTYDGEVYEGRDWPLVTFATLATGWTAASFAETTKGGPATGGTAEAICLEAVTTGAGVLTTKATFLVRTATVDVDYLTIPAGANKVDVIAELEALGIACREEVSTAA